MDISDKYLRSDEKVLSLSAIDGFFKDGTFADSGNDLFTQEQIDLFIEHILMFSPLPMFGATQNDVGDVIFTTGKLQQLAGAVEKFAQDNKEKLSPLKYRKMRQTYFKFVVIVEEYNKDFTLDEMKKYLTLYL